MRMHYRSVLVAVIFSMLFADQARAQTYPAPPDIFAGVNYPLPPMAQSCDATGKCLTFVTGPAVVPISQLMVAGWAFNKTTGQQPVTFLLTAHTDEGEDIVIPTHVTWRIARPDVSTWYNWQFAQPQYAYMLGTHVSGYTGFYLWLLATPPLNTVYLQITYYDDGYLKTLTRTQVQLVNE